MELATSLYPPVGVGKMSVNPKGGTATGIGAGTAAGVSGTGDGAHAGAASAVDPAQRGVRFPVRCSRRQLNGYFKDMNIAGRLVACASMTMHQSWFHVVVPSSPPPPRHTVIQVLESTTNRPVGCVFLHDLVRLTEDEAASSPSNTVPLSNKGMPGKKKLPSKGSPSKVPPSKAPAPATTATPSKASNGPRMINGFYPILAPPQSTTSRAPPIGKQQKTSVFPTSRTTAIPQDWVNVGKAHFIITLEPVTSTERRQQMQEGSTAVPYFFDRHTNADASFQSTRYNGAGQAVASSFDEPSTLSQATAPIEPPLPPAEMTMMSLPGSPIKQVPAPARKPSPVKRVLFQSRSPSPVSRKEVSRGALCKDNHYSPSRGLPIRTFPRTCATQRWRRLGAVSARRSLRASMSMHGSSRTR